MFCSVRRDCDSWRLRKVVVIIFFMKDGELHLIDRSRMFAGLFFRRRLCRHLRRAAKRANVMIAASMDPLPVTMDPLPCK